MMPRTTNHEPPYSDILVSEKIRKGQKSTWVSFKYHRSFLFTFPMFAPSLGPQQNLLSCFCLIFLFFLPLLVSFFKLFFSMSARSQFYVSNKTCSLTFAASRQNSDLSPGSQPHNAARDHPHHQDHHALGQNDDEEDEENECVYKLSFPTFNC